MILLTTVVFPDPVPPAIPIVNKGPGLKVKGKSKVKREKLKVKMMFNFGAKS
jgi:hypothetical protein